MSEITIKFPSDFELAVRLTKEELEDHILLMAALKMFELGKISSGKAAEFAGLSRVQFFDACKRYKVSVINYSVEEILDEVKHFENSEQKNSGN
jgi:predicted HTH domain antitoxin